jgi:MFS family permease
MIGVARRFGALYIASLLIQLGATLLISYLALRLNRDGVPAFWIGSLMAAHSLGMVLGAPACHFLIGRIGHVRAYAASAGLIVAAVLAHTLSTSLPFWLLLRGLVGLAMMCQLMVLESWLNERAPAHQRGLVLAMYMVATYLGMVIGQLGLGLADVNSLLPLMTVAIAFALCLMPLALTRGEHPESAPPGSHHMLAFLAGKPHALSTVLISGMLNGTFFGLAAIYAREQGLDTAAIGHFMAVVIGAGLLAQYPLGLISDRLPRIYIVRGTALLLMAACIPLCIFHALPFEMLLCVGFMIGCLQFSLYPLGVAMANEHVPSGIRVALAGVLLTIFSIGAGIGPLICGALMERLGAGSFYYFFAIAALCLALITAGRPSWAWRRPI